jgi:RimJ/RimL family protein N-acetyltransferase
MVPGYSDRRLSFRFAAPEDTGLILQMIREEFRGKGYGEALLREVCKLANQRRCGRVEWWVLDWNKRAIDFYKKIGACPMSEWTVFRLDETSIDDLISEKG